MSLDVYLTVKGAAVTHDGTGVFVREAGQTRELTAAEIQERWPESELAAKAESAPDDEVYSANITHNLNRMAKEAGLYDCLWRPDEHGLETAGQLIEPLQRGLALLSSDRARFEAFNPENGWGTYDGLVEFVVGYLAACVEYPQAIVSVSR